MISIAINPYRPYKTRANKAHLADFLNNLDKVLSKANKPAKRQINSEKMPINGFSGWNGVNHLDIKRIDINKRKK